MLDLNELERKLDEALDKETKASLSEWLLNQRKDILYDFLESGIFETKMGVHQRYPQSYTEILTL